MKLTHLRSFVTAAAEGSLHRASARLNIAQPALSRQVRDLEQELGVVLFARSPQGLALSPAGEVLLQEAKQLLEHAELAKAKTRRAAIGQFGTLKIGFSLLAAESRPAMATFAAIRRTMPDIDVSLSLINSDQQYDALAAAEIDVGVLYRREPQPAGLHFRDLRVDRYMLLVHDEHPLTALPKVRLADLRGEYMTFASPALRPATYHELMSACLRGGLVPRTVMEFEKFESETVMINLAAEGIAVSLANSSLRERGRTEGVTFLPIEDLDMPLHLSAMWRADRETPVLLDFVNLLNARMTEDRVADAADNAGDSGVDAHVD